ncbi:MAG: hypothetical protein MUC72_00805 [Acidobacteria bacterium]|jgi:hypothetical protein|nr:hypothetical protein [Acidobacteriota bacterium]
MKLTIITAAPPATYIAFALALYVWHVAAALLGVFIADRIGVGDSGFDLKGDLKKTGICSLIALSLFLALFYFAQHPAVFIVYILVFLFSLKAAYLGSNNGFQLMVLGTALAGMIAFVPVVVQLGLRSLFFLYLALFIAFLVRHLFVRKKAEEQRLVEKAREEQLRRLASQDANFATFCHQCAYFHQDSGRCLLQVDGRAVREIKIDRRAYCTSFMPRQAGPGK